MPTSNETAVASLVERFEAQAQIIAAAIAAMQALHKEAEALRDSLPTEPEHLVMEVVSVVMHAEDFLGKLEVEH